MKTFEFKINEKNYKFIIESKGYTYEPYCLIVKESITESYPLKIVSLSALHIVNKIALYSVLRKELIQTFKSFTRNNKIIFGRSNTVSKILTNFIHNDYIEKVGLSKENIKDFAVICKKVNYPKIKIKRKYRANLSVLHSKIKDWHSNMPMYDLSEMYLNLKKFTTAEELNYVISDLKKFDRGYVKYILQNKCLSKFFNFNEYNAFVKSCPKWLKKSKYNLSFFTYKPEINAPFIPTNRWEYWLLASLYTENLIFRDFANVKFENIAYKAFKAGKKSYDIWRKIRRITGPYNKNTIINYYIYLADSERLYNTFKEVPNSEFRPLSGSGRNFIDIAEENHRLEIKYRKQLAEEELKIKLLTVKELCDYEPLEKYRLKTNGDLVNAGRECHHCIGSYVNDKNSLFYRKGDVCAQVSINTKEILQCWDKYNKKTDASREFEQYLREHISKAYQKQVPVSMNSEYVTPINNPRDIYANIA